MFAVLDTKESTYFRDGIEENSSQLPVHMVLFCSFLSVRSVSTVFVWSDIGKVYSHFRGISDPIFLFPATDPNVWYLINFIQRSALKKITWCLWFRQKYAQQPIHILKNWYCMFKYIRRERISNNIPAKPRLHIRINFHRY